MLGLEEIPNGQMKGGDCGQAYLQGTQIKLIYLQSPPPSFRLHLLHALQAVRLLHQLKRNNK